MGFSINNILTAFGNKRTVEQTQVDNVTSDIINSIKEKAFAVSEKNVMYAAVNELGGYYSFKTVIVGGFKIKTHKGATLTIHANNFELELITEMDEFESEHSNVPNRHITSIDFQIEKKDALKIGESKLSSLVLKAKKHRIEFAIIKD